MPDVKNFEPICALDGGIDGLDFYRCIVNRSADYLKNGGNLILEIGETQAKEVSCLLSNDGRYNMIKVTKDIGGYDRAISARKVVNG
jgi:release factor glutamine methyltransferase